MYNVYRCADGCDEVFLGQARTLAAARKLRARVGLGAYLYETARVAGHCGGLEAPDKSHETDKCVWVAADVVAIRLSR